MKNNKIYFVVLLLLFIIGFIGYGVFSYFWTEGSFSGDGTVSFVAFNPETTIAGDSDFLGHGGSVALSCYDSSSGIENITCSGAITVTNNGPTTVNLEIISSSGGTYHDSSEMTATVSPDFSWTTKTLSPGSSTTLYIIANAKLTSYFGDYEAHYEDYFESSRNVQYNTYLQVYVDFKLKATEVH